VACECYAIVRDQMNAGLPEISSDSNRSVGYRTDRLGMRWILVPMTPKTGRAWRRDRRIKLRPYLRNGRDGRFYQSVGYLSWLRLATRSIGDNLL
jgi:hypothetical protein